MDATRLAAVAHGSIAEFLHSPAMSRIVVSDLTKVYGDLPVIEPMSLAIEPGTFVSIIGPSGCGKTTLMRTIAGLEHASSGTLTVDGDDPNLARTHKRVAMVPQQPALLPWRNVRANAHLLLDTNRAANPSDAATLEADLDTLLSEVGLADFLDAFPHELSGGMQQRVALVRALALHAPLLVMDEPFAALDELTRSEMRTLLSGLVERRHATVFFITHSISEAVALSDRVLVTSPRPATIVADITIDLPRPRRADIDDDPQFVGLCADVRHALRASAANDAQRDVADPEGGPS